MDGIFVILNRTNKRHNGNIATPNGKLGDFAKIEKL
jgi:hypothetical protein